MAATILPIVQAYNVGAWGDQAIQNFPEGASQTFKLGNPLKFSSGKLVIFANDNDTWAGVAVAAATGTTGSTTNYNCPVIRPDPFTVFRITVDNFSSSTAAAGTGHPSDLTIGATYAISQDTGSGYWYARVSGGNASVLYLGTDSTQNSLVNGWGYFQVLPASTVYQP